jgi:hypothetical protein
VQLGRIEVRGENGVLKVPIWALTRQRSNPFHAYLIERIDGFVDAMRRAALTAAIIARGAHAPGCCWRLPWLTHCATAPSLDGIEPSYAMPPPDLARSRPA